MKSENKSRLRIQSCINAIIEVYDAIQDEFENNASFMQLEQLESEIRDLDMSHVSEMDIRMVEQTTNALLGELKPFFDTEDVPHIMFTGNN